MRPFWLKDHKSFASWFSCVVMRRPIHRENAGSWEKRSPNVVRCTECRQLRGGR